MFLVFFSSRPLTSLPPHIGSFIWFLRALFHVNSFKCFLLWSITSCSHKKTVLHFLEQLCSFYENNYLLESSKPVESSQAFIDKVCEFAEANELSSKTYRAALSDFSADKLKEQLNKVLCYWRYSFSIWELLYSFLHWTVYVVNSGGTIFV